MEVQMKKRIMGSEEEYKELLRSMEVVKEKRWVFKRSLEVEKKIIAFKTKYGSSNKKKSWFLNKNITNCYEVWKLLKKKRWVFERSLEVEKKIIASKMKYGSSNKKKSGFYKELIRSIEVVKKKDGYLN